MFWLTLALLVVMAGFALRTRKKRYSLDREPWEPEPDEEDPLDMDEIRRAEREWEEEAAWEDPSEEEWR